MVQENPKGLDSATIAGDKEKYAEMLKINAEGRGYYTSSSGGVGMKVYEGAIMMPEKKNGDVEWYLFDQNYGAAFQVASKADPVVSPMAMNEFSLQSLQKLRRHDVYPT